MKTAEHLSKNANMWRMTGDFWDQWDKLYDMFSRCYTWQNYVGSGRWPDCDMLPLGRLSKNAPCHGKANRYTNFTKPEQITMMTLWGIFRSPLMFGGNMPENDEWTLSLLTNEEYMKMHRTSYGAHQLLRKEKNGRGTILWVSNGRKCKYLAVFNTDNRERNISVDLREILMPDTYYNAYDIWEKENAGKVKNRMKATVAPHGAGLYKIYE